MSGYEELSQMISVTKYKRYYPGGKIKAVAADILENQDEEYTIRTVRRSSVLELCEKINNGKKRLSNHTMYYLMINNGNLVVKRKGLF